MHLDMTRGGFVISNRTMVPVETVPRKEYNIRASFSTFLEDLIWSMYLHRKLQKFGMFLEDV